MRKLIAGIFSPGHSFHIYDCGEGRLEDAAKNKVFEFELHEIVRHMNEHTDGDTHFLVREVPEEGWFCEYVVRYKPNVEIFIIGYGKDPQEALNNTLNML